VSLRVRVVLATAVAVIALDAVGGVLAIRAVENEFLEEARTMAENRARELAQIASVAPLPTILPAQDEGEVVAQVVQDGDIISSTAGAAQQIAQFPRMAPGASEMFEVGTVPGGHDGPFQVAVVGVDTLSGPATVFVAVSTEDLDDVVGSAMTAGGVGLVMMVVPVSLLLWLAVGRALAAVEAIRGRAERITAARLSDRVPEPTRMDEIGRLARTINAMLARLDASASEQKRFLADAAHELRSPVTSLRAQLETMRGSTIPDTGQVADLLTETIRLQTLVDQLLLLARSDAGTVGRLSEPVDLDDVVSAVVTARRTELGGTAVRVDTTRVQPVQVTGESGILEQVVRNLLDNALRYAHQAVHIGLTVSGANAVLTVDDDGPGIPPEARAEVFHRFTRLDTARDRDAGGVGLGLAIVKGIVTELGGSVRVTDSPYGGARFEVNLPANEPSLDR
jgi:signal transduction histidine kinase